ncbi:hypothetical protein HIM_05733 [Hirsutella minnesotensis 3608]|uniref:lipoyl(octanoyl) transferase n=1 Tax=Hirsutella minnesotensis 3608 TaxID=1043627 RepID=A0A0F8A572_9HYPO|nr:hypothetical protein HIM_05733 [Hirsutella minnesotensis 3608]
MALRRLPGLCANALQRGASQRRHLSLLEHRHLRGVVEYDAAQDIQDRHRAQFLSWKALSDDVRRRAPSPRPLLLSFESSPTFTVGRRQDDLDAAQVSRLRQSLRVELTRRHEPIVQSRRPEVKKTSRGGLTTYHGPGQLVFWPVIDMHSPLHAKFGVASYAAHLEATTQRLLTELFGIQTSTVRDEPGVWVDASSRHPRKIAAMGVHHRRHVTALGLALNVDIPVTGGQDVNPWARFVPCGLHGKDVTSVAAELGSAGPDTWDLVRIAEHWAAIFEQGLLEGESLDSEKGSVKR